MIDEKELVNFIKEQQAEDEKAYKMLSWDNDFRVIYEAKTKIRMNILNFIEGKAIPNERNMEYMMGNKNMKKSNISYNRIEQVILSMNVTNGVGTAFSCNLTGEQIDELETLIERLIKKCNATTKE